ncbi:MAG TPA: sigma-54-dependent Fis family transcriptional regulator [Gemmatimonadaceae bacterium]|nr:sigma-54-dependent Fis family transcriptional regulator [Gemmatimonadaceae bacterium]
MSTSSEESGVLPLLPAVKASEQEVRAIVDAIPHAISVYSPDGTFLYVNRAGLEFAGITMQNVMAPDFRAWLYHPDDVDRLRDERARAFARGVPFETEQRVRRTDDEYRWVLVRHYPLRDENGRLTRWYATGEDIHERKRAEEKIRQSEKQLRQLLDLTPLHITEFGPDGSRLYNNQAALEYHGMTLEEWQAADLQSLVHPQDAERLRHEQPSKFASAAPYEIEARLKRRDGQYRWFLARFNPVLDGQSRVTRWYVASTDIEDRKQAEQRLHDENLALRERIDEAFMFEEIVGSSPVLKTVLASIVKVAPTDSTVLITGETGTGKELIARAIHKRSRRSGHAFIGVNCAAIPSSLIASELFGHEKGAFTGALQQRRGRFELAHSGTIFLDEIGDLPAETQIALLRVLQEREIERVGSSRAIAVDVRVLAATNRDLETAVESGAFRQDLYYRLNVFPIRNPSLRERVEDIPVLVEYLVERYAKKAGKSIRKIKKQTLELFQAYDWPGNVRELQNVIERAVVLCEGDTFVIDPSWLHGRGNSVSSRAGGKVTTLSEGERALIEAALAETNGRISGPSGAAAKLGIPRQTLESKMRALNLDRRAFRVR